jgi:hypothetical protein
MSRKYGYGAGGGPTTGIAMYQFAAAVAIRPMFGCGYEAVVRAMPPPCPLPGRKRALARGLARDWEFAIKGCIARRNQDHARLLQA